MEKWMRKFPKFDDVSRDDVESPAKPQGEKPDEREKQFEERFQHKSVKLLAIIIILLSTNEIWIFITKFTYSVFTHRVQNCIFMVKFLHVDLSAVPEWWFCVHCEFSNI